MCKKLTFMLMVLAVVGLAVPANAADYWLAGDWNGWQTGDPNGTQMTDNLDGTYSATVTGLGASSRQEFKVVHRVWDELLEQWVETWIPGSSTHGSNAWLYADGAGAIDVGFNINVVNDGWLTTTNRLGLSTDGDGGGWVIAGSFGWSDNPLYPNGAGGVDWSITAHQMTETYAGSGIYELEMSLPVGGGPSWAGNDNGTPGFDTYAWKAVVYNSSTWDSISEDGRGVNTGNAFVVVNALQQGALFSVDAYTGVVKAELIPEPATIALLGMGGLALLRRKRGYGA